MISAVTRTFGRRNFSTSRPSLVKVAILGAAGGIGQPLALLLKQNPLVTELSLYDIRGCPGVAADVAHINTPAVVSFFPYLGI
jgi:malate dehydrogenase